MNFPRRHAQSVQSAVPQQPVTSTAPAAPRSGPVPLLPDQLARVAGGLPKGGCGAAPPATDLLPKGGC